MILNCIQSSYKRRLTFFFFSGKQKFNLVNKIFSINVEILVESVEILAEKHLQKKIFTRLNFCLPEKKG